MFFKKVILGIKKCKSVFLLTFLNFLNFLKVILDIKNYKSIFKRVIFFYLDKVR